MSSEVIETLGIEGLVAARLNGDGACTTYLSNAMRALDRVISGIAATDIPVLLMGESGSGKQVLAAEIHRKSRQAREPLVHVSCGSISVSGLSEWLQSQNGNDGGVGSGTLFLDEVSQLSPDCQRRLLQALPTGNGLPSSTRFQHRVISSTRKDLQDEMREHRFLEELYYRINGACLRLPPLRHRREDIPLLIEHFLIKYAAAFERPLPKLGTRTVSLLAEQAWQGNVRELENVVKKIVALGDEEIAIADLPGPVGLRATAVVEDEGLSLKRASRQASMQAERELILKVLSKTRWNRKRAAQELRISYKALLYKLKQIGVEDSPTS